MNRHENKNENKEDDQNGNRKEKGIYKQDLNGTE